MSLSDDRRVGEAYDRGSWPATLLRALNNSLQKRPQGAQESIGVFKKRRMPSVQQSNFMARDQREGGPATLELIGLVARGPSDQDGTGEPGQQRAHVILRFTEAPPRLFQKRG